MLPSSTSYLCSLGWGQEIDTLHRRVACFELVTCCSNNEDGSSRFKAVQQLGRYLWLLFMLPLNCLNTPHACLQSTCTTSNPRLLVAVILYVFIKKLPHVHSQSVLLKLHKLADQLAKTLPIIASLGQLFPQLLNNRI